MSIANIDLNLVLVLHTVLVERNVARAAERLRVTPSAVSNALARLRDLLGDPLVTRKGRGIVPTPRALELAPGIARAVEEIEIALAPKGFEPDKCTRRFTLAVADLGQVIWGPRLALAMEQEMPAAQLRIVGIDALVSLGDLSSEQVDLHLGIAARRPGMHVQHLYTEKLALVARRLHPIFRRGAPAISDLRRVQVEMLPAKSRASATAVSVPSFGAAVEIVAATDLVTMLPLSFLAAKGRAFGLRAIPGAPAPRGIEISMCWHERTHRDPAAKAFRSLVRRAVSA